jgi:hypothetical protein
LVEERKAHIRQRIIDGFDKAYRSVCALSISEIDGDPRAKALDELMRLQTLLLAAIDKEMGR